MCILLYKFIENSWTFEFDLPSIKYKYLWQTCETAQCRTQLYRRKLLEQPCGISKRKPGEKSSGVSRGELVDQSSGGSRWKHVDQPSSVFKEKLLVNPSGVLRGELVKHSRCVSRRKRMEQSSGVSILIFVTQSSGVSMLIFVTQSSGVSILIFAKQSSGVSWGNLKNNLVAVSRRKIPVEYLKVGFGCGVWLGYSRGKLEGFFYTSTYFSCVLFHFQELIVLFILRPTFWSSPKYSSYLFSMSNVLFKCQVFIMPFSMSNLVFKS